MWLKGVNMIYFNFIHFILGLFNFISNFFSDTLPFQEFIVYSKVYFSVFFLAFVSSFIPLCFYSNMGNYFDFFEFVKTFFVYFRENSLGYKKIVGFFRLQDIEKLLINQPGNTLPSWELHSEGRYYEGHWRKEETNSLIQH